MAGFYIHIPFCKQACIYCNFHFSTNYTLKDEMVKAICNEIELRKEDYVNQKIHTIYFGGGTPSILNEDDFALILKTILKHANCDLKEITVEANPDDINQKFLNSMQALQVNRFSIGIQSFNAAVLKWMNRAHTDQQSDSCIKMSQDFGFENLSCDLIYGIPETDSNYFKKTLSHFFNYNVPHLSAYALTIEENTALHHKIKNKSCKSVDEKMALADYSVLSNQTQTAQYEHYEISNFAKDAKYAMHNTNYWKGEAYFGFGPAAHSYAANIRRWNVANNMRYIHAIRQKISFSENEILTEKEIFNEYIMINLRTIWGINFKEMQSKFDTSFVDLFLKEVKTELTQKNMRFENGVYHISSKAKFISDTIISNLFIV